MSEHFKNKTAIITGSGSPRGIGRAICNKIAAEGCNLVLVDLNPEGINEGAKELSEKFGIKAIAITANITNEADCEAVMKQTKDTFGGLDFLVNNAGVVKDNLLMRMSEEDFDFVIDVNLKGTFLMTKAASRLILKSKTGRIVNISSISGLAGQAGQANYTASKAGVIGLTKVTAREFAGKNVLVNAVAPGFLHTDLTATLPENVVTMLDEMVPLKRPGTPDDVAGAVKFFLSEDSSYITGTVLRVDGGTIIGM